MRGANRKMILRDSLLIVVASGLAAVLGARLATYGRSWDGIWQIVWIAWLATLFAVIPSVLLRNLILAERIRHLASIAWRFPFALATTLIIGRFEGEQRKWFLASLVTCYLVSLTLESWLQIRQVQTERLNAPR
jgi:predicted permease